MSTLTMQTQPEVDVVIREAVVSDLPAIERLLEESDLPTAGVAQILSEHPDHYFVAVTPGVEDDVVGVAGLEVCTKNALLRSVAVRPEWRARHVGQELVRHVVCSAESRGIPALYLLTMTAEHYFPRFGFERIARDGVPSDIAETLEFKSACPATAVAMEKALSTLS